MEAGKGIDMEEIEVLALGWKIVLKHRKSPDGWFAKAHGTFACASDLPVEGVACSECESLLDAIDDTMRRLNMACGFPRILGDLVAQFALRGDSPDVLTRWADALTWTKILSVKGEARREFTGVIELKCGYVGIGAIVKEKRLAIYEGSARFGREDALKEAGDLIEMDQRDQKDLIKIKSAMLPWRITRSDLEDLGAKR